MSFLKLGGVFRNELSTPPLQKTINSKEDVRTHLFQEEQDEPELEATISVIPMVSTFIFRNVTTVMLSQCYTFASFPM